MFQGINIIDFMHRFSTKENCLDYLSEIKWREGFTCKKCGHSSWCKTKTYQSRKCTKCKRIESPTAGTLFHKVKFPLPKAFYILFMMSTSKKSCSSLEFKRKLGIHKKTSWLFQHKVRQAMKSSKRYPITSQCHIDEFVVGGPEDNKKGRSKGKKKEVAIAIEYNNFGILRTYCKVIKNGGTKELKPFFKDHIASTCQIETDKWRGYTPLKTEYPFLEQKSSNKGKNFKHLHRQIMMIKAWLRGIHHHCEHLQNYLDEYCYRQNRIKSIKYIFNNLIERMMNSPVCTLKNLQISWGN